MRCRHGILVSDACGKCERRGDASVPPDVQRVLDAARALGKVCGTGNSEYWSPQYREFAAAIDALDAPGERYELGAVVFKGPRDPDKHGHWLVMDRDGDNFYVEGAQDQAANVVAALNAAERGKE